VVSADGSYRATWSPVPSPIPFNEPFALRVVIEPLDERDRPGASGHPSSSSASGATGAPKLDLRVDARMPEHFHGMNRTPQVVRAGDRTFDVQGMLFHMSGRWVLDFDIQREGVTERARAEVFLP
jgi:hypothetical protein